MKIDSLHSSDIPLLHPLQPDGWQPIIPYYEFYVATPYCNPLKCVIDGKIVGIGSSIQHQGTAWLGHIIVHSLFRRQGIGTAVTRALMNHLSKISALKSIHLVATPMGEPLYRQLGFHRTSEYIFLGGGRTSVDNGISVEPFSPRFKEAALEMDYDATSEERWELLEPHWNNGCFTTKDGKLTGLYMPTLGEGYILATSQESGLALLRKKHSNGAPSVIPEENRHAIGFLEANGFSEYRRGIRMSYGEPLQWHPQRIYGRIGGNLG